MPQLANGRMRQAQGQSPEKGVRGAEAQRKTILVGEAPEKSSLEEMIPESRVLDSPMGFEVRLHHLLIVSL